MFYFYFVFVLLLFYFITFYLFSPCLLTLQLYHQAFAGHHPAPLPHRHHLPAATHHRHNHFFLPPIQTRDSLLPSYINPFLAKAYISILPIPQQTITKSAVLCTQSTSNHHLGQNQQSTKSIHQNPSPIPLTTSIPN
jgi:hypothetical protein